MRKSLLQTAIGLFALILFSCGNNERRSHEKMIAFLKELADSNNIADNDYASEAKASFYVSHLQNAQNNQDSLNTNFFLGKAYMEMGTEQNSISIFERLLNEPAGTNSYWKIPVKKELAISWLRTGERINCIANHGAESCIFPIQGKGLHGDKTGSSRAIELYKELLEIQAGQIIHF